MRTLLTTGGRVDATDTDSINRCFVDAHKEGLWLDIERPDEEDFKLLRETFKFHPLTIEDIQHQNQRPKVDEYPDYNFAVIFQAGWQGDDVDFREHHLFIGPHYLISVHLEPSSVLDTLKDRLARSPELTKGQPALLRRGVRPQRPRVRAGGFPRSPAHECDGCLSVAGLEPPQPDDQGADRDREPVPSAELPDWFLRHELRLPDHCAGDAICRVCPGRRHDAHRHRDPAFPLPPPGLDLARTSGVPSPDRSTTSAASDGR